jgi:hypothetical protein
MPIPKKSQFYDDGRVIPSTEGKTSLRIFKSKFPQHRSKRLRSRTTRDGDIMVAEPKQRA